MVSFFNLILDKEHFYCYNDGVLKIKLMEKINE